MYTATPPGTHEGNNWSFEATHLHTLTHSTCCCAEAVTERSHGLFARPTSNTCCCYVLCCVFAGDLLVLLHMLCQGCRCFACCPCNFVLAGALLKCLCCRLSPRTGHLGQTKPSDQHKPHIPLKKSKHATRCPGHMLAGRTLGCTSRDGSLTGCE